MPTNPENRGSEPDELIDASDREDETAKGSPTPHPGEPDVRDGDNVNEDPEADEVRRGTRAPGVPQ